MEWRRTWPDKKLDYSAEEYGHTVGRMYHATHGPRPCWIWTAYGGHATGAPGINGGIETEKQAAADAIRRRWEELKAWSRETGKPLLFTDWWRPPDAG